MLVLIFFNNSKGVKVFVVGFFFFLPAESPDHHRKFYLAFRNSESVQHIWETALHLTRLLIGYAGGWDKKEQRKKGNALVFQSLFWCTFWTYHFFFGAQDPKLPKSDMKRRTLVCTILLPDHNDINASWKSGLINAFVQFLHSNQDLSCKLSHVVHSLKLRGRRGEKKKG